MRPYWFVTDERLRQHGNFNVPQGSVPDVRRPNRLAAGMSYTRKRSPRLTNPTDDVLFLLVRGTLDSLRSLQTTSYAAPVRCQCCGGRTERLALSESGKLRLRAARRRKAVNHPRRTLLHFA